MPNAYSYIRFSTRRQIEGDSIRRQIDNRNKWLEANSHLGLTLVEDYRDLGISAFKGKNRTEGALSAFLQLVETGKIPRGSYLLVENLDRLSREEIIDALSMVLNLLRSGITIVTVMDGMIFTRAEGGEKTMLSLMFSLVILSRAADESQTKSNRGRGNWEGKRAKADQTPLTKMAPAWLDFDADQRRFVPNEHAATVRRIFELSASGHGAASIMRKIMEEGCPAMSSRSDGGKWNLTHVRNILANRSVIGEFRTGTRGEDGRQVLTGDVHLNYYPTVITPALWQSAHAAMLQRQSVSPIKTNAPKSFNVFAGLGRCAECGGNMVVHTNGKQEHLRYIRCQNHYVAKTCKTGKTYAFHSIEPILLDQIERFLMPPATQDTTDLDARIAQNALELERATTQLGKLLDAFGDDDDATIVAKIQARKATVKALKADAASLDAERVKASAKLPTADQLSAIQRLRGIIATGTPEAALEARTALAHAIRQVVALLAFNADGSVILSLHGGMIHVAVIKKGWLWTRVALAQSEWFHVASDAREGFPSVPRQDIPAHLRAEIREALGKLDGLSAKGRVVPLAA